MACLCTASMECIYAHAQIDTHQFQGRLSPILLVGTLAHTYGISRCFTFVWGCCFWAVGRNGCAMQCLVPIWVFLGCPHLHGKVYFCWSVSGMEHNWGPLMSRWSASWEVMRGVVKEECSLKECGRVSGPKMGGSEVSKDSCPALLFVWSGAVLNRPYILSSVEDHIPVREWLIKYGENALNVLECDHLVVGNPAMNRKTYSLSF